MVAPDVLLTALKPVATLKTSLKANYDRRTDKQKDRQTRRRTDRKSYLGAQALALPKNLAKKAN